MDPVKKLYLTRQKELIAALKSTRMPRQNIRASELAKCKRQTFYRLYGYIPAVSTSGMTSARLNDYGIAGDQAHDHVRRTLQLAGLRIGGIKFGKDLVQEETESFVLKIRHREEDLSISMRLDGTATIDGLKYVLEIKSLGMAKFQAIRREWERTNSDAVLEAWVQENRKDFVYQTHACMKGAKINRALIIPYDRSDCAIGLHSFKDPEAITAGIRLSFNKDTWTYVLDRCATIMRSLRMETPPAAEFTASSTDCKQCHYFHLCHGADRRRVASIKPAALHPQLGTVLHVEDLK